MSAESESSEPPPPPAEEVMQVEERKPGGEEVEGSGNFEETLQGGGGGGGGDGQVGCEEQVAQLGELEEATGGSEAVLSEGKDQCVVSGGGGDLVGVERNLVLEMEVEAEVKEQVGVSQHETLLSVTINGAEGQTQSQVQPAVCPPSLSEVSQPNTTESQTQSQVQPAVCPPSLSEVSQPNCTEGQMQSQLQSTASPNFLSELPEANCPEDQSQSQLQLVVCPTSLSELSPTSVTQPISSAPSPPLPEQRLLPAKVNNASRPVAGQQNSSNSKNLTIVPSTKTPIHDGYNWRKYGQKQVKSPKGSRSYYKCTYSECCAKKIECSDHSGHVIEIVNKGTHSHDPPRKNNCTRDSRVPFPAPPISVNSVNPIGKAKESTPSTLSSNPVQEPPSTNGRKRQSSSSFNGRGEVVAKEEHVVEPEPKRRVKKSSLDSSGALLKSGKKPKYVVHAAGDVGISGDGYRWRKYGQKMVKGNPHPRNYYRCTSAGCPVRKHIETAVDNANALIITYKGVHDHDMPVPKKRHGAPSAPLIAAAAPASMINSQPENSDTVQNLVTPTQLSAGKEGQMAGETKDLGGKKTIESARTLLSIGFEIKPC